LQRRREIQNTGEEDKDIPVAEEGREERRAGPIVKSRRLPRTTKGGTLRAQGRRYYLRKKVSMQEETI